MFITLADLPPKPKPIPKVECPGVTMWIRSNYRKWLKAQNKQAGATNGSTSTSKNKPRRRKQFTHPYIQNKDGTLVADLTDMSAKVRSVWESLKKRGMAPKMFGKITSEAWEFLTRVVLPLPEYEFLLYCEDGEWKLREWCKDNYSSWTRNCGLRQPVESKTESADEILNSSKLLRMDTPEGDSKLSADNLKSKTGSEDSEELEEDDGDSSSDDDDDEPPPARQKVCVTSFILQ